MGSGLRSAVLACCCGWLLKGHHSRKTQGTNETDVKQTVKLGHLEKYQ